MFDERLMTTSGLKPWQWDSGQSRYSISWSAGRHQRLHNPDTQSKERNVPRSHVQTSTELSSNNVKESFLHDFTRKVLWKQKYLGNTVGNKCIFCFLRWENTRTVQSARTKMKKHLDSFGPDAWFLLARCAMMHCLGLWKVGCLKNVI